MIGSGSQNSQCQLRCSSMSPPTTRPRPPPTPRIADISPMLPAIRSAGNSSRAIANASGKMPPATPWMTRATISVGSDSDRAASSVPAESTTRVHTNSRCLPYMSPSLPMIAVPIDADSRNPVSSQVTPVSLACRSCCNVGSAGITAELSTAYTAPASDRTARITFGWTRSAPRDPARMPSLYRALVRPLPRLRPAPAAKAMGCRRSAGQWLAARNRAARATQRVVPQRAGVGGALGQPAEQPGHRAGGQDAESAVPVADPPLGCRGEEAARARGVLLRLRHRRTHDLFVTPEPGRIVAPGQREFPGERVGAEHRVPGAVAAGTGAPGRVPEQHHAPGRPVAEPDLADRVEVQVRRVPQRREQGRRLPADS